MNPRNSNGSARWATTIKAATLVIVVGTLAVVPLLPHSGTKSVVNGDAPAASAATPNTSLYFPDMSVYFPSRFPAPEHAEPQAPTF